MLAAPPPRILSSLFFFFSAISLVLYLHSFHSRNVSTAKIRGSCSRPRPWFHWTGAKGTPPSYAAIDSDDYDKQEGGPRVRQATMIYDTDKFNGVYERAVDTHHRHGQQWDTPTHILRHDIVEAGFFNKQAYLLSLISAEMATPYGKRAEWIVWFDADSIVVNPNIPWTLFLPPQDFDEIHMLGTKDQNGLNAGMLIVRVSEWSVKTLAQVLALQQLRPDVTFEFFDQGATRWVIEQEDHQEKFLFQPHNWWNSFAPPGGFDNEGRFLLHFAGHGCCGGPDEEKKPAAMSRWLDKLETSPQNFAIPLENTSYPSAVEGYWTQMRSAKAILKQATHAQKETSSEQRDLKKAEETLRWALLRNADEPDTMAAAIVNVEQALSSGEMASKEGTRRLRRRMRKSSRWTKKRLSK